MSEQNDHGVDVPVQAGQTLLICSDLHFFQQDKRFIDLLVDVARDLKPDLTLFNGDIHDCHALSSHVKEAKLQVENGALEKEAEASASFFKAMHAATKPGGRKLYGAGNHEHRWDNFVNLNPGLFGIPWYTPYIKNVQGWELYPQGYEFYIGGLTICHGDELSGALTKYSCARVAQEYPRENLLYGHTHRIERYTKTNWADGRAHEHGVWTTGHGQDVAQVEYKKRASWRLGFAVVLYWKNGRDLGFTVVQHEAFRVGTQLKMHSPLTGKVYSS